MRTLLITLPLPPAVLGANAMPPSVKAKIRRDRVRAAYRAECGWEAWKAIRNGPAWVPAAPVSVSIRYVLCRPETTARGRYQPRDVQNAEIAMKAGLDGALVDAGVLGDDSLRYACGITTRIDRHGRHRRGEACAGSRVEVMVTEVEA